MAAQDFRQLHVWRNSMAMAKEVYRLTSRFPDDERFGLISQMRRAAVSVPSNIAEGNARRTRSEYVHFLGNARGSLAELQTQLLLAQELGLGRPDLYPGKLASVDEIRRMLSALVASIERSSVMK